MMTVPHTSLILIYGNSPRLAAVERQLRTHPSLRVIQIDPAHPAATQQLSALGDGVLIYDCGATEPQVIGAIHVLHPRIPTVGLGGGDGRELTLLGKTYSQEALAGLGVALRALLPEEVKT